MIFFALAAVRDTDCVRMQLMFVLGLYFRSYWLLATWATIVATVLLPAQTHWQAFLDAPLFASWRQYFSYSIVFDTKMDPKRKFMFAHVPHVGLQPPRCMCRAAFITSRRLRRRRACTHSARFWQAQSPTAYSRASNATRSARVMCLPSP